MAHTAPCYWEHLSVADFADAVFMIDAVQPFRGSQQHFLLGLNTATDSVQSLDDLAKEMEASRYDRKLVGVDFVLPC